MTNEDPFAWPKVADRQRLQNYHHFDKLYAGEHYHAFAIKASKGFPEHYAKLRYIVGNFPGLISRVIADMLFGEPIVIDCKDKKNQGFVDGLIEDNHFIAQLYESSLANSRRGDSLFKLRLGPKPNKEGTEVQSIFIEEIPPSIYFPIFENGAARNRPSKEVLAWTWVGTDGKTTYLQKETHTAGLIETSVYIYNPDQQRIISRVSDDELKKIGIEPNVVTKVNRSLLFYVPNFRDGTGYWGTSDYRDLETLFFALNNRITKIDNILDKHSDPILAVPPGVLDEKGTVRKESLGMFEVNNDNAGFNKPEYIVWNANLESAFKQIEKLVEMTFMFSEIAPASLGKDEGGQAESGRALKFKLLRTIAKRNRKKLYYDLMIKDLLETALYLGKAWDVEIDGNKVTTPEVPEIKWGDGVIPDITEMIEAETSRLEAGLSSRADSIARLDGLKPEDAQKKVIEIDKEGVITVPNLDDKNNPPTPPVPTQPAIAPAVKE